MLDKNEILDRIDILSYYSEYVEFEDKTGKNRKAKCPFHKEESGSFYVEIDTGRWYCQGACSTGGDIIAFHMRIKNLEFKAALADLARMVGVTEDDSSEPDDAPEDSPPEIEISQEASRGS